MRACLLVVAIALTGCAPGTQYIRADGQYAAKEQVDAARAACDSGSSDNYCMLEHGYFSVPAEKAEAKRVELAAIVEAGEQRRRAELAAIEAAKRKQAALNKKKQKKTVATPERAPVAVPDVWGRTSR